MPLSPEVLEMHAKLNDARRKAHGDTAAYKASEDEIIENHPLCTKPGENSTSRLNPDCPGGYEYKIYTQWTCGDGSTHWTEGPWQCG